MKHLSITLFSATLFLTACTGLSQTIHLVERSNSDVITDLGAEGDSVGDVMTFANELYNASNETKVGHDNGYCVRTVVGEAFECTWTIILEEGQITVQGPFYDKADSVLAITGGTGAYKTARGDMQLKTRNEEGTEFDFILEVRRDP